MDITAADLQAIIRSCADNIDMDVSGLDRPDFLDLSFSDLGFDSLAVVELAERIADESAITIPQHVVDSLTYPRQLLDHLREQPAQA
jgi:minimal PKS acyl carrier protein